LLADAPPRPDVGRKLLKARQRIRPPNESPHAIFHVIVENQIALGDELPMRRAVDGSKRLGFLLPPRSVSASARISPGSRLGA
jgi:hypothetical protein